MPVAAVADVVAPVPPELQHRARHLGDPEQAEPEHPEQQPRPDRPCGRLPREPRPLPRVHAEHHELDQDPVDRDQRRPVVVGIRAVQLAGGEERARVDVRELQRRRHRRRAPEKPGGDQPAGREQQRPEAPRVRAGSRRFGAAALVLTRRLEATAAAGSGSGSGSAPSSGLECGYWSVRKNVYAFVWPAYRSANTDRFRSPSGAFPVASAANQVRIASTTSATLSAELTRNAGIARRPRKSVFHRFWRRGLREHEVERVEAELPAERRERVRDEGAEGVTWKPKRIQRERKRWNASIGRPRISVTSHCTIEASTASTLQSTSQTRSGITSGSRKNTVTRDMRRSSESPTTSDRVDRWPLDRREHRGRVRVRVAVGDEQQVREDLSPVADHEPAGVPEALRHLPLHDADAPPEEGRHRADPADWKPALFELRAVPRVAPPPAPPSAAATNSDGSAMMMRRRVFQRGCATGSSGSLTSSALSGPKSPTNSGYGLVTSSRYPKRCAV